MFIARVSETECLFTYEPVYKGYIFFGNPIICFTTKKLRIVRINPNFARLYVLVKNEDVFVPWNFCGNLI